MCWAWGPKVSGRRERTGYAAPGQRSITENKAHFWRGLPPSRPLLATTARPQVVVF